MAMVPPEMRQQPHVSFTQIDQYLRCPLKYRFTYIDRLEPEFVPAALAFGSGIHGAAAFLFRGGSDGTPPSLADVQAFFERTRAAAGTARASPLGSHAASRSEPRGVRQEDRGSRERSDVNKHSGTLTRQFVRQAAERSAGICLGDSRGYRLTGEPAPPGFLASSRSKWSAPRPSTSS